MCARKTLVVVVCAALLIRWSEAGEVQASPMGTAFTYQGRIEKDDAPADGLCDFEFRLYDTESAGSQVGSTEVKSGVSMDVGLFTVNLDFGSGAFNGGARWMAISVCCPSPSCTLQPLDPRVELTPAPYALRASNGVGGPGALNVTADDKVGIGTDAPTSKLDVVGDVRASDTITSGNSITIDGINDQILSPGTMELHVGGARVLRFEPGATSPNLIGGYSGNSVESGGEGATIGGGGLSGGTNRVTDSYGTVGGGSHNLAGSDDTNPANATLATVGGGYLNTASGNRSTVGGGANNTASDWYATVGGGSSNVASDGGATVGGGSSNVASDSYAAVGGGISNTAGGFVAAVGGGNANIARGEYAAVGGGYFNTASGDRTTVAGGGNNTASDYSAAVGGGRENTAGGEYATVGGGSYNVVSGDYGTIAGGGPSDPVGDPTGTNNVVYDDYGTIGGGGNNRAGSNDADPITARRATVCGGTSNVASGESSSVGGGMTNRATAQWATIGGGNNNTANGQRSTIAGGLGNLTSNTYCSIGGGGQNRCSASSATVGGGSANEVSGQNATIAGGARNLASATSATVGGGDGNEVIAAFGTIGGGGPSDQVGDPYPFETNNRVYDDFGTIGGGGGNVAGIDDGNTTTTTFATVAGGVNNVASGSGSTVAGGSSNTAGGDYSVAAGRRAQANDDGAFVWADSNDLAFPSTTEGNFTPTADNFLARTTGGVVFVTAVDGVTGGSTAGVKVAAGGGSWSSLSDRHAKDNTEPVTVRGVLERLDSIPISTWNYKAQDESIRHIGPMAQDFYEAFGVGEDQRFITTIDADGVALAAIQGLHQVVREAVADKDCEIDELGSLNAIQQQRIANLEARLAAVEKVLSKVEEAGMGGGL